MTRTVLELKEFGWTYDQSETSALRNLSITVEAGERVGIVGSNESGKTTLSRCLNGLIPFEFYGNKQGTQELLGQPVTEWSPSNLARRVGLVFSDPEAQFTSMNVEDELLFGLEGMAELSEQQITDRFERIVEEFSLESFLDKAPYDLSGGQKQAVALASVMVMEPEVLVLDEPTSMLDPTSRDQIFSYLERIHAERDVTLIVIEHDLEHLLPLVDRVVWLEDGTFRFDGSPEEFLREAPEAGESVRFPDVTRLARQLNEQKDISVIPYSLKQAREIAWS